MNRTVGAAGQYAAAVGIAGVATATIGFGLLHLAFAVPQAVLPTLAGVFLAVAAVVTTPAGRRIARARFGMTASWRRVGGWIAAAVLLCALYVAVTFAMA